MTCLPDAFRRVPLAHRGLHDLDDARPENSRAAIRAAIAAGYGIEIDLQPSLDGTPMVFHDYHLGRLTPEHGPIRQRDSAELATIPLAGGVEGIPELSEILEDSYRRFPRRYLFPVRTDTNKPMVQANAARFVESAWILNKEKGPSANDIRSALTTRFFLLNMDIVSRERFARRSMSNYQNMEAQYFKVHESSTRSLAFDD